MDWWQGLPMTDLGEMRRLLARLDKDLADTTDTGPWGGWRDEFQRLRVPFEAADDSPATQDFQRIIVLMVGTPSVLEWLKEERTLWHEVRYGLESFLTEQFPDAILNADALTGSTEAIMDSVSFELPTSPGDSTLRALGREMFLRMLSPNRPDWVDRLGLALVPAALTLIMTNAAVRFNRNFSKATSRKISNVRLNLDRLFDPEQPLAVAAIGIGVGAHTAALVVPPVAALTLGLAAERLTKTKLSVEQASVFYGVVQGSDVARLSSLAAIVKATNAARKRVDLPPMTSTEVKRALRELTDLKCIEASAQDWRAREKWSMKG